jgi:antirestriction protein
MTREISNSEDIIDSRDVIERIAELTEDEDRTEDETAELEALSALADNAEDYAPDWSYGEALIRDSYFVTYAQELADDIGAIDSKASWPLTCIDWEQAARDLRMDYTAVDFGGVTYWVR